MSMNLNDLNELAAQCERNSERWFPHLHDPEITSQAERLKHLTLGLVEEVAELSEVVWGGNGKLVPHEIIDVLVYALNIGAMKNIDFFHSDPGSHVRFYSDPGSHVRSLSIVAGAIAGVVKKSTGYVAGQNKHSDGSALIVLLPLLVGRLLSLARTMGIDLQAALDEKTSICEERWG